MFYSCKKFNSDLSGWDVSNGEEFQKMFFKCTSFNADLSKWDVSKAVAWHDFATGSLLERYPERIPEKFRDDYLNSVN
jgi:surface protein